MISFRVLGVVTDPPDAVQGDTVQVSAVLADAIGVQRPESVTWAVCAHVAIDPITGSHTCLSGDAQVLTGVDTSFVAPAPDGNNPYQILGFACAGGSLTVDRVSMHATCAGGDGFSFVRSVPVRVPPGNHNPGIAHVLLDGVELLDGVPGSAPLCQGDRTLCRALPIRVQFSPDAREIEPRIQADGGTLQVPEVLITEYLVDAGDLDGSFRSDGDVGIATGPNPDHTNTFVPPSMVEVVTLWVLALDDRGGFSYVRRRIDVAFGACSISRDRTVRMTSLPSTHSGWSGLCFGRKWAGIAYGATMRHEVSG